MTEKQEAKSDVVEKSRVTLPLRQDGLTAEQHDYLLNPLRGSRVAKRSQGGKQLSYLESWDVKAHLTRIFGFGNWDSEVLEATLVGIHEYISGGDSKRAMVEPSWHVRLRLTVRDQWGGVLATHVESAVGSSTGAAAGAGLGDLHDNAVKSAASDALKRCAIAWGAQMGLSLYDNGSLQDVVRVTLVRPEGATKGLPPSSAQPTPEQAQALAQSVGRAAGNEGQA